MSADQHNAPATAQAPRPNVIAFMSPTTTRFVVLLGALVSAGLFLGTWLHNESPAGADWTHRVAMCSGGDAVSDAPGSLAGVPEFPGVHGRRRASACGLHAGWRSCRGPGRRRGHVRRSLRC
jgi:hypothetical protein